MNSYLRSFAFVLLAIILVIGVDHISARDGVDQHQQQDRKNQSSKHEPPQDIQKNKASYNTTLVPFYSVGDLFSKQTQPEKMVLEKKSKTSNKSNPTKRSQLKKKKARMTAQSQNSFHRKALSGDRPVLEVDYEVIGFNRYLEVIERVGRLFVLIETKAGTQLGPEVSLKRQMIYDKKADMSVLAVKRPHMVSDEKIFHRLSAIEIPENALADSVVLILTKPFDDLLWSTITKTLKRQGVQLKQISHIVGVYTSGPKGVFLRLDGAVIRATGKKISLGHRIRVSL